MEDAVAHVAERVGGDREAAAGRQRHHEQPGQDGRHRVRAEGGTGTGRGDEDAGGRRAEQHRRRAAEVQERVARLQQVGFDEARQDGGAGRDEEGGGRADQDRGDEQLPELHGVGQRKQRQDADDGSTGERRRQHVVRGEKRSLTAPPSSMKSASGTEAAARTAPTARFEPVSWSTSQATAT